VPERRSNKARARINARERSRRRERRRGDEGGEGGGEKSETPACVPFVDTLKGSGLSSRGHLVLLIHIHSLERNGSELIYR